MASHLHYATDKNKMKMMISMTMMMKMAIRTTVKFLGAEDIVTTKHTSL